MIIDGMVNMPAVQESDITIRKKNELENQRPVEESEKSNNLELNFSEDRPETVETADGPEKKGESAGDIYNERGRLLNEKHVKQVTNQENKSIDMIV